MPSFTFVSTANAFALRGARPVFVDIREDTLNLDERLLPNLVGERTRAVVPVHYAGVGCEMDEVLRIADEAGAAVVEDNAHGLLGSYRGRLLGTFGRLATQSFHETKNITCGEGGALVLNDPDLVEQAEIIREKAPTAPASCAGRSTSTPGSTSAPAFFPPTSSRPSSAPSSTSARASSCAGARSGLATARASQPGRQSTG